MSDFFDGANDVFMGVFAELFTYKKLNGDVELSGIFAEAIANAAFGGVAMPDKIYELSLPKSAAETAGIEIRQSVVVRGVEYHIINIQTDITDMTKLTLRRYK